jgi:hypothetical protein
MNRTIALPMVDALSSGTQLVVNDDILSYLPSLDHHFQQDSQDKRSG